MYKGYVTEKQVVNMRRFLEPAFSLDTAVSGSSSTPPSSGHCAAVAYIVRKFYGGDYMSTIIGGQSHWFNRLKVDGRIAEVDLTGDQFGRQPVQIGSTLYPEARERQPNELNQPTIDRADKLFERALSYVKVGSHV